MKADRSGNGARRPVRGSGTRIEVPQPLTGDHPEPNPGPVPPRHLLMTGLDSYIPRRAHRPAHHYQQAHRASYQDPENRTISSKYSVNPKRDGWGASPSGMTPIPASAWECRVGPAPKTWDRVCCCRCWGDVTRGTVGGFSEGRGWRPVGMYLCVRGCRTGSSWGSRGAARRLGGPLVLVDVVVWGARSPFREGHRRRVQDRLRPRASRPGVRRPALRW